MRSYVRYPRFLAIAIDPFHGGEGIFPQAIDEVAIAGPSEILGVQNNPQGRCIDRSVVRRMGNFAAARHFSQSQLVQNFAGFFLAPVIANFALVLGQNLKRVAGDLRVEDEGLQGGNNGVASEQG